MFGRKSKLDLAAETSKLVAEYMAAGGHVHVIKSSRSKVKTFGRKGALAHHGAKAISLRNSGIYGY